MSDQAKTASPTGNVVPRAEAERICSGSALPAVMWHGTKHDRLQAISAEGLTRFEVKQYRGDLGEGVYLTPDKDTARLFGDTVIELRVNVRNPFILDPETVTFYEDGDKWIAEAIAKRLETDAEFRQTVLEEFADEHGVAGEVPGKDGLDKFAVEWKLRDAPNFRDSIGMSAAVPPFMVMIGGRNYEFTGSDSGIIGDRGYFWEDVGEIAAEHGHDSVVSTMSSYSGGVLHEVLVFDPRNVYVVQESLATVVASLNLSNSTGLEKTASASDECKMCGGRIIERCRCPTTIGGRLNPHTEEDLRKGYGALCINGHRCAYGTDLWIEDKAAVERWHENEKWFASREKVLSGHANSLIKTASADYSCVMLTGKSLQEVLSQLHPMIDKADLAPDGIEKEPHVTVLFGLHTDDHLDVMPFIRSTTVELKGLSLFESDEHDVLKVDIESKGLTAMSRKLREKLEYTNEHDDYKPHATVAYLKPGKGKEYVEKLNPELKRILAERFEGKPPIIHVGDAFMSFPEKGGKENAEWRAGEIEKGAATASSRSETWLERAASMVEEVGFLNRYLKQGYDPYDYSHLIERFLEDVGEDHPEWIVPGVDVEDDPTSWIEKAPEEAKTEFRRYVENRRRYSGDEWNAPPYETMSHEQFLKPGWMVHFTDDAKGIAAAGFMFGHRDMEGLALTNWKANRKTEPGYNFAFQADSRDARLAARERKYGRDAVVFWGAGVKAYHYGDEEHQVLVWGPSIRRDMIFPIFRDDDGWRVDGDTGRTLVRGEFEKCVAWVEGNWRTLADIKAKRSRPRQAAKTYWGREGSGYLFVCPEDRTAMLLLRSGEVMEPGTWGIPGGAMAGTEGHYSAEEAGGNAGVEQLRASAKAEVEQEIGFMPQVKRELGTTEYVDGGFRYVTFVAEVSAEEKGRMGKDTVLNWENDKAEWFPLSKLPEGLHHGVAAVAEQVRKMTGRQAAWADLERRSEEELRAEARGLGLRVSGPRVALMLRLADAADAKRADVKLERVCNLRLGRDGTEIAVWLVDGLKVRDSMEIDFTNFSQPLRFDCIPRGEFWIDKDTKAEEHISYIVHMAVEYLCMAEGASYDEAESRGKAAEEAVRNRLDWAEPKHIKKSFLGAVGGLMVWLVDGRAVRDTLHDDFTEGGNDKVYGFIPEGEIWIDEDVDPAEIPFVEAHEAKERSLMAAGMPYEQAHTEANRLEQEMRMEKKAMYGEGRSFPEFERYVENLCEDEYGNDVDPDRLYSLLESVFTKSLNHLRLRNLGSPAALRGMERLEEVISEEADEATELVAKGFSNWLSVHDDFDRWWPGSAYELLTEGEVKRHNMNFSIREEVEAEGAKAWARDSMADHEVDEYELRDWLGSSEVARKLVGEYVGKAYPAEVREFMEANSLTAADVEDSLTELLDEYGWADLVVSEFADSIRAWLAENPGGYGFMELLDMYGDGNFDWIRIVKEVAEKFAMPRWRQNFPGMDNVEESVREAIRRLESAREWNQKVAALSLALNVQHYYGNMMRERLDLNILPMSDRQLDRLSALGDEPAKEAAPAQQAAVPVQAMPVQAAAGGFIRLAARVDPQGVTGYVELRGLKVSDGKGHDGRFYLFRSNRDGVPIYYVNRRPYFGESSSGNPRVFFGIVRDETGGEGAMMSLGRHEPTEEEVRQKLFPVKAEEAVVAPPPPSLAKQTAPVDQPPLPGMDDTKSFKPTWHRPTAARKVGKRMVWTQSQIFCEDGKCWDIEKLKRVTEHNDVREEPTAKMQAYLFENAWGTEDQPLCPADVLADPTFSEERMKHMADIQAADLERPMILRAGDDVLVDGYHRLARAFLDRKDRIRVVWAAQEQMSEAEIDIGKETDERK